MSPAWGHLLRTRSWAALDATASTDRLVLSATTDDTAGTSFNLTVTAENSSGTRDTGYTGTIQFTSSDVQAGLPTSFTFTTADAGTYTFPVILKTAGSQSITATDTSFWAITGTLSGISVSPAPASQFVLSDLPSTTTAGRVQNIAVTAEDPYGNVATDYVGNVQFTSSDPKRRPAGELPFTPTGEGVHVFKLTLETAGTQSVDGDGHRLGDHRHPGGNYRAGSRGRDPEGQRLPDLRHGRRGR